MSAPLSQNGPADQPPQSPPPSLAKSHPVLMMTVIGLGIAIVLVLALMVGMIVKRATSKPDTRLAESAVSAIPQPPIQAAPAGLQLAPGASVVEARIDGGVLLIRTSGPRSDDILTFDPKTGKQLTRISFEKTPAP